MNKEFRGNHKKQAQNNGLNASCCSVLIPSRNLSRSRIFLASGESNSCRFKTQIVIMNTVVLLQNALFMTGEKDQRPEVTRLKTADSDYITE